MIVRLTSFNVVQDKIEELKKIYEKEVVPTVKQQKGNLDCRLLEPNNKSDEFISITEWDNMEDAKAYSAKGVYKSLIDKVRMYFTKDPVVKEYTTKGSMAFA